METPYFLMFMFSFFANPCANLKLWGKNKYTQK